MLHRLEIANFYSIRDRQVIDLRAAANAPNEPGRLAPLWPGSQEKAPKVVALFGANGSGKTNVLRALSFLAWFVKDSFSAQRGNALPIVRFNDIEMSQAPTCLAVHMAGIEDVSQIENPDAPRCKYAYEVSFGGGPQARVDHETLHYWPSSASRRVKLFERNAQGAVTATRAFGLAGFHQALEKVLRPNASVIATLAHLEHKFSKLMWEGAARLVSNVLVERQDGSDDLAVRHFAANPRLIELFNNEIERIDLGIVGMQVRPGANGPAAFFRHQGLAEPMPIHLESHGTRQFIRLYPLLSHALQTGGIAVLDELDSAIHPLLLPEILRWFHDPVRNPRNGQLWMSCQNVFLLEELTKEEIIFCEKENGGQSRIFALRDIQSVRRNDNYYRKYIGGAFGAVPHIG